MKIIDIEIVVGIVTIMSSIIGGIWQLSKIEKTLNNDIKDLRLELINYARDRDHAIKNEQNILYGKLDERLDHIEQNYVGLKYQLNSIQNLMISKNKLLEKNQKE